MVALLYSISNSGLLSFFLYFFFNNNNEFSKLYTWMYLFVTFFFLHNYQSLGQYSLADKIMIPGLFSQRVQVR